MISKKEFNKYRNYPKLEQVYVFLRKNNNNAFTRKEIVDVTGFSINTVVSALQRLVELRMIVHKSPYYMAKNKR